MIDGALCWWMFGVAVAHGLRFVVRDDPLSRQVVAGAGVVVYLFAAVCAGCGPLLWAQVIAVLFPVVGLVAVLATRNEPDDWQVAVGVTQVAAAAYVLSRVLG